MSWLVVGAGTSGRAAAQLLKTRGFNVLIVDDASPSQEAGRELNRLGISFQNSHDLLSLSALPASIDGLILSPGIPLEHPLVVAAKARQLPIRSEIDLALDAYSGQILAVTGTNGKSTTVSMLSYILTAAGCNNDLAGNIGLAPSQILCERSLKATLVLELSSYQLEHSHALAPRVAVLTNLSPDHLARHKTLEAYIAAKWRIFARQGRGDTAIIERRAWDAAQKQGLPRPSAEHLVLVDERRCNTLFPEASPETELLHNRFNASFAILAASAILGREPAALTKYLNGFRGLAHRCEKIGTIEGQAVYNDSKATNVDSTLTALASQNGKVILFLGGQGKGESFRPISAHKEQLAKLICFGKAGPQAAAELHDCCPVACYPSLRLALESLEQEIAGYSFPLLFSPACASFDEFRDFEDRGRFFTQALTRFLDP